MLNLTKNRNSGRSAGLLILLLLFAYNAGAQVQWKFKKFSKEVEDRIELPYGGMKLWLFEKDSQWGLYDEETEKQVVPPKYDMVLPGVESGFYYVFQNGFVGFYAQNGGEIISPDEFQQLQLVMDTSGVYFLQHAREITRHSGSYTTHTTEYRSFELLKNGQSQWTAREVPRNPLIRGNSKVEIKNDVKLIHDDQWIHHYSYILETDAKKDFTSPVNYFKVVDQQSGVISIDKKRYLIPPEYAEITWQEDYFRASAYTMDNPINPLAYALVESIFTTDFQLIESPPAGYAGLILGGGYYTHDMDGKTVVLYDSTGNKSFTIDDYGAYPEEVLTIADKYYLACCPENVEEEEMRVFRQSVYNRGGQLQKTSKFRFEQLYEDKGLAITSILSPEVESFDLVFGLYDLRKDEFMISPEYEELYGIPIKNSLAEIPDPGCDIFFTGKMDETYYSWDCRGEPITTETAYVSGEIYEVEALESLETTSDSLSTTHIIEDPLNDYTYGDLGYYNARIEDTWRDLIIYRCTHEYDDDKQVFFALGDSSQLFLAPEFTSIRFDKADKTVHLEYKSKTYIFPVSRYGR